jgi:hypothetical protein
VLGVSIFTPIRDNFIYDFGSVLEILDSLPAQRVEGIGGGRFIREHRRPRE